MSRHMAGLVITTLLWLLPQAGLSATVVGVVSDRSAPQLAAGAERLVEAHPGHSVVLRTPEQLAQLSDGELANFFSGADALLLAAVFGDQVGRLQREIAAQASRQRFPILAINGDQRLTRMSRLGGERVMAGLDGDDLDELVASPEAGVSPLEHLRAQQAEYPRQAQWLEGRAYYQGRSAEHMEGLLRWLLAQAGNDVTVADPQPRASIRYYQPDQDSARPDPRALELERGDAVAIVDLDTGDRPGDKALLDALCRQLEARDIQCFAVLANWGGATVEAIRNLPETVGEARLGAIVALQDFTLGGGDGRREVTEALTSLDVPVLKGIRLAERTRQQWRLSSDGMPADTVHYQLAMPELQGISQPMVLATAAPPTIDELTGVRLMLSQPVSERVESMADRLQRWLELRRMDNADKRIALIYYNHPPGRQNIGADNLDVPESLFEMLTWLRDAGFETGELPDSADALLDRMQQQGVNMLQDQNALAEMAGSVPSLSGEQYRAYYDTLPTAVRAELEDGPLGYLHAQLERARDSQEIELAQQLLTRRIKDIRHLIEQHEHPAQARALDLLDQYESGWSEYLEQGGDAQRLAELRDALMDTGIPGLSGWGEPPGRSMVHDGRMLFPGLRFGNIFIGPQPPRGWEIDEELLHANTTFPPTHQYVGFYHWLRDHFEADALVYTGRHSTREFLPRRRAGLTRDDYPDLLGGDLPLIYPYIVDGVGEGIQAKRRALGVMISHLTPPLAATELYDELLELRQLVETYESSVETDSPTRNRAVDTLRERVAELNLSSDLEREIAIEQGVPPDEVSLEDVSADLLVHEVGHYLTDMQERFMPLGLHVFGQAWDEEALETMLTSMAGPDEDPRPQWREALEASPVAERESFMAALDGRFIPPGQGNDPVRTPEVLPTGRNFHALSSDLIPTRVAWSLGSEMAEQARQRGGNEGSEALVLWASDTVRDEGVMIAFGLNLLGVRPQWNSRGIVEGLERMSLTESENVEQRRDVLFTASGLFRDLYQDQLEWLDQAVRVALAGAGNTIRDQHPQLRTALDAALADLPEGMRGLGGESLERNRVAARWVADTRRMMEEGVAPEQAGNRGALRVFGSAPGSYGAGVNRLASRSGAWESRRELGRAYRRRMGHAYGSGQQGQAAHDRFDRQLQRVGRTYLARASHLYGLLDNDDGFDFQGGLSTAVEQLSGEAPANRVLQYGDESNPRVESLERALLGELRARNLNPQWLRPLMEHDYAGARTMGRDFLDNLWGWQVTSPDVVKSWVWDEVNAVYFQDRHDIGLDEFLSRDNNVHVKTHMQSVALLAAKRDFWNADQATIDELARDFASLVVENGFPGSGHTRPEHPLLDWVGQRLGPELRQAFQQARAEVEAPQDSSESGAAQQLVRVQEIEPAQSPRNRSQNAAQAGETGEDSSRQQNTTTGADNRNQANAEGGAVILLPWLMAAAALVLLAGGFLTGWRGELIRQER